MSHSYNSVCNVCNFEVLSIIWIVTGLGKIVLEANLDKEVFYHGQDIPLHVSLNNNSKKTVKSIQVQIKTWTKHLLVKECKF